jgi:hygromycin-B 7''-O-kinase
VSIARQTGELLAALHTVPCHDLPLLALDWPTFALERASACVSFQRERHLAAAAVEKLPSLLDDGAPLVPDARRALLHADLHHEHVLLEAHGNDWRITGMIDFGDAVVGHPEYDLIAPVFFVAGDDHARLHALFEGAGFRCNEAASRRMMAWSAMHRFNALARFLPPEHGAEAIESLRARYWPVA